MGLGLEGKSAGVEFGFATDSGKKEDDKPARLLRWRRGMVGADRNSRPGAQEASGPAKACCQETTNRQETQALGRAAADGA